MSNCYYKGKIAESAAFEGRHPRFAKAFAFLRRPDLKDLAPGRHAIDGDDVYASVSVSELKLFAGPTQRAEVHRTYIDIQAPLDGPETIGVVDLKGRVFEPFDAAKDCGFADVATEPLTLQPGEFVVFMPVDGGHAPCHQLDGSAQRRKVVVKVRA